MKHNIETYFQVVIPTGKLTPGFPPSRRYFLLFPDMRSNTSRSGSFRCNRSAENVSSSVLWSCVVSRPVLQLLQSITSDFQTLE